MKKHIKHIPRVLNPTTAFMSPSEGKREKKRWKKPVLQAPVLSFEEVPQRLPYRKGDPEKGEDPALIYYDSDFLHLIRK